MVDILDGGDASTFGSDTVDGGSASVFGGDIVDGGGALLDTGPPPPPPSDVGTPGVDSMPRLIVEAAFGVGSNTGSWWTIGDQSRGLIGTFTLGPELVFTDITNYVQRIECTAGASSRVTQPLIEYEAGTARLLLNNASRAFDPFNVNSPFFAADETVVIPVPGRLSNAITAEVTVSAFDAGVSTDGNAPGITATATATAFNATVTTVPTIINASPNAGLASVAVSAFDAGVSTQDTAPGQTANVTVTAFNATVVVQSNGGGAPNGMLFGSSCNSGTQAQVNATIANLDPAVIRTYEALPTSYANTAHAKNVPPTIPQYLSFKPDMVAFADTASASYATIVRNLKATISGLSDIPGHRVIIHHEPFGEIPGSFTAAEFRQCQINCRRDVIDPVNNDVNNPRVHPIWFTVCTEGFRTDAEQDTLFTTAVCNVLDEINWDCYGFDTATPPDKQITRLQVYAAGKGLPWSVAELGYSTNFHGSDVQLKSAMVNVLNDIAGWTTAQRPVGIMWFNGSAAPGRGNDIDPVGYPLSCAYWKNVCENSTVPAT